MFGFAVAVAALLAMSDIAAPTAPPVDATAVGTVSANPRRIAAGTPVTLDTVEPLNSAKLKQGDRFALRLAASLTAGSVELLPAGTPGVGEVIHADRSHGGGRPGELLIAARYLEVQGVRIPLRRYRVGAVGTDRSGAVLGASFAIGPFAMFMRGGEIEIPAGTPGEALVAEDVDLATSPAQSVANP